MPRSVASFGECRWTLRPCQRISPSSGWWMPAIVLISVLLPAPLSPTTAVTWPMGRSRLTGEGPGTGPNTLRLSPRRGGAPHLGDGECQADVREHAHWTEALADIDQAQQRRAVVAFRGGGSSGEGGFGPGGGQSGINGGGFGLGRRDLGLDGGDLGRVLLTGRGMRVVWGIHSFWPCRGVG